MDCSNHGQLSTEPTVHTFKNRVWCWSLQRLWVWCFTLCISLLVCQPSVDWKSRSETVNCVFTVSRCVLLKLTNFVPALVTPAISKLRPHLANCNLNLLECFCGIARRQGWCFLLSGISKPWFAWRFTHWLCYPVQVRQLLQLQAALPNLTPQGHLAWKSQ